MRVEVQELQFSREGRQVLDVPAFSVEAGSVTALFGANGAGKSTLLRLVGGVEALQQGTISIGSATSRLERSRLCAMTFQDPVFLRGSVRDNLELGLKLRELTAHERAERVRFAAEECGIDALLERRARELSAGEAQRAALARAMALRAPVMLLDEPLAGLDQRARRGLLHDLPRLLRSSGATAIVVSHDREEAFRLADRLAVMVDGQVIRHDTLERVYQSPGSAVVAELLGYTALMVGDRRLAVPPDGLSLSAGEGPTVIFEVDQVIDIADRRHVIGRVGDRSVECRLGTHEPVPTPGSSASADHHSGGRTPRVAGSETTIVIPTGRVLEFARAN